MISTERLEAIERDAWGDLYGACPADLAKRLGLAVERMGGALFLQLQAIDHGQFNRLCGIGLAGDDAGDSVRRGVEKFRAAGIRNAWFQPAPGAIQAALDALLTAAGLRQHQRRWAKFERPPVAPAPARGDLTIIDVGPTQAADFATAVLAGFGLPPILVPWLMALPGRAGWQCFLALADGAPVAGAALYVSNGLGWLGLGATRPEHRRRGAQSALIAARIEAGLRARVQGFVTETGVPLAGELGPSFANIQRAGFRIAYERENWSF